MARKKDSMALTINVTGNSIEELRDRLASIAAHLSYRNELEAYAKMAQAPLHQAGRKIGSVEIEGEPK